MKKNKNERKTSSSSTSKTATPSYHDKNEQHKEGGEEYEDYIQVNPFQGYQREPTSGWDRNEGGEKSGEYSDPQQMISTDSDSSYSGDFGDMYGQYSRYGYPSQGMDIGNMHKNSHH